MGEGWHYLNALRRAHVPYRFGRTVVRALGAEPARSGSDRTRRWDGTCPSQASARTVAVDMLCVGFGLLPNIELTQVAGCALHHDPAAGGWVPILSDGLETSVSGLFAAGETAGIGGAGVAMVEGRMAALRVAARLGRLGEQQIAGEIQTLSADRRRLRRFGAMINTLFAPHSGLDGLAAYDTPICRCEDVLAGELLGAVAQGARGLDELKTRTRIGQGPCQGRTCGPLAARLVARQTGLQPCPDRRLWRASARQAGAAGRTARRSRNHEPGEPMWSSSVAASSARPAPTT